MFLAKIMTELFLSSPKAEKYRHLASRYNLGKHVRIRTPHLTNYWFTGTAILSTGCGYLSPSSHFMTSFNTLPEMLVSDKLGLELLSQPEIIIYAMYRNV